MFSTFRLNGENYLPGVHLSENSNLYLYSLLVAFSFLIRFFRMGPRQTVILLPPWPQTTRLKDALQEQVTLSDTFQFSPNYIHPVKGDLVQLFRFQAPESVVSTFGRQYF
jgi:hypothetical protein